MKPIIFCLLLVLSCVLGHAQQQPVTRDLDLLIVRGASGLDEYAGKFDAQVKTWSAAASKASVKAEIFGTSGDDAKAADAKALAAKLHALSGKKQGALWLVLIGHGTFDGREAKFNLRGPDITPKDLAGWLQPMQREVVVIHTGSASGAFVKALTGPRRLVIASTKGGDEVFYSRFGEYFAPAIAGLAEADLDKDKQVSLLEAFLHASRQVAEFYEREGRLATEHALIEDNGDGTGTRSEVFAGLKAASAPKDTKPDGARAAQVALVLSEEEARLTDAMRARRDALESQVKALNARRAQMQEDAYYAELEKLLRDLAAVYSTGSS